ncbi:membrane-associated oxidoreductase [Actinomadura logoneensis]|uniref:Membrane-associated oxidoreductase n=1 Tax=Actinomadura logoneensis TaxID=2293572 RepID=A0A372JQ70_9ACTN|nr:membrane-associated oxidoreductase [Actinomadura logoneensis]RFU41478.1 membrane-associated oxidoreductase [Actinomadura logoneensis]
MRRSELSRAERSVWRAFASGEAVDLGASPGEDATTGASWGRDRTVRASVLRALLLNAPTRDGEVAALRLNGARIVGRLNLRYATVDHAIRFWGCHFEEAPNLYGARFRQLNLSMSYLPALEAATIRVAGVLRFTDCVIPGPVQLGGARIEGALFMERARLGEPGREGTQILHLNHTTFSDDVWAPGLRTHGEVSLVGSRIAGTLNLEDAVLSHPGHTALHGEMAAIANDVRAKSLCAEGRVNLRGVKVGGQVNLAYARLSNPGGVALRVSGCTIGELWFREAEPIVGHVNMRRASFRLLNIPPKVWPETVALEGLDYGSLTPRLPARDRIEVFKRDESAYVPHSYEQLAAYYRRVGDEKAARNVQIAKQRHYRRTLPWYGRVWGYLQDGAVGYGYRPLRSAAWLAALWAFGATVFWLHNPPPVKADEHPPFNAFAYALDLLLPIISFGQEDRFAPRGGYQWLSYALVVAGWTLASTTIAGVSRALNRQ